MPAVKAGGADYLLERRNSVHFCPESETQQVELGSNRRIRYPWNCDAWWSEPCQVCIFEVNTRESSLKLLGPLVRDLQHTGVAWTGVKALHFRFYGHSVAIRGYVPIVFNKNASDDILKLAVDLADRFPNVLELHTESLNSNVAIGALVRYLVDKFAVTVTSLNHNLFYPISVPAFSDTLAHLSLIMSPTTVEILPRVNADALKTLKLRNCPADYSWTSFANGQTSGSINFAQLKKLSIGFLVNSQHTETDNGGSELGRSFQMSFPALEYLHLDNWNSAIKKISTALFPAYMPNIHVSGSTQAIKSFFWHKFGGFGNFKIGIRCYKATDMDTFYETTNRFFNRLRIDGQAALDLVFDCYDFDTDRINWTNLTFLTISGHINIETISALLPRLPSLTNLEACGLVYSEYTYNPDALDQSTPLDLASLSTAAPLSTSVKSIKLTYNGGDYICGPMEDGVVQLILRVPSLTFLFIQPNFGPRFIFLKEKYGAEYPHLSDIDFFDVSQDY